MDTTNTNTIRSPKNTKPTNTNTNTIRSLKGSLMSLLIKELKLANA